MHPLTVTQFCRHFVDKKADNFFKTVILLVRFAGKSVIVWAFSETILIHFISK